VLQATVNHVNDRETRELKNDTATATGVESITVGGNSERR